MTAVFVKLLNMSIAASFLVLAVVALRALLKQAPRWMLCSLWALVALRLICPVSLSSSLSVFNLTSRSIAETGEVEYFRFEDASQQPVSRFYGDSADASGYAAPSAAALSVNPAAKEAAPSALAGLWLTGMAAMLFYALCSYLRLRRRVCAALPLCGRVWLCDEVESPFILGVLSPRIYLPSDISEAQLSPVIAHERAHLARRDQLWKPLGFLLLSVYWFNPLMWLAYILLCRDIELACDERVIGSMDTENKKAYSAALLSLSAPRPMSAGCPLAFGEVDVKARITSILSYKKPAFWVILVSVLALAVLAVCFLTGPRERLSDSYLKNEAWALAYSCAQENGLQIEKSSSHVQRIADGDVIEVLYPVGEAENLIRVSFTIKDGDIYSAAITLEGSFPDEKSSEAADPLDAAVSAAILAHCGDGHYSDGVSFESHCTFDTVRAGDSITVYCDMLCQEFRLEDGKLTRLTGGHYPVAITFNGSYELLEFWQPQDGSYYEPSIREKFPASAADEAMDIEARSLPLTQQCYAKAIEYFSVDTDTAVDELLAAVLSSPADASSPADYISAHPSEYRELNLYGDYALAYVLKEFIAGGQAEPKGQLMRQLLDDLAPESAMRLHTGTGQEYFDVWRGEAEKLKAEKGLDFMREYAHGMYLLMQLTGE